MDSESSPARMARECVSIADPATTSPAASRLIVEALVRLRSRSCIIDGEAVVCDDNGVASFDRIRYRRHDDSTFLYAFDPLGPFVKMLRKHL